MIKSKVETQSGKWNEFVPKCRQANKLKKAKTLFTATFLTELEFTGWRTVPCNKFTCAQYDVISVCSKFTVVDIIISPSLRNLYVLYNWTALLSVAYVLLELSSLTHHSPTPPILCQLTRTVIPRPFVMRTSSYIYCNSSKAAYSQQRLEISALMQLVCRYSIYYESSLMYIE